MKKRIKITSLNDTLDFIRCANACDGDVIVTRGKWSVDGKSLIGVASLDMSSDGASVEYEDELMDDFLTQFEV